MKDFYSENYRGIHFLMCSFLITLQKISKKLPDQLCGCNPVEMSGMEGTQNLPS